jgi:site-specific DNA recombinase
MELGRLQSRLDVLYDDRLDGRIDVATYDKKAEAIRENQQQVRTKITQCQPAGLATATEAIDLMSLTSKAAELFMGQSASEQRRLLRVVLQEAIWQNGQLRSSFREPFEQLRLSNSATLTKDDHFPGKEADSDNWLGGRDSNPDRQIQNLQSYRWTTSQ